MFTHRKLLTVCCAAVFALGLAACGSSDDDTAADDTPTVTDPAGPTQAELDAAEAAAAEAKAALKAEQYKQHRATSAALKRAIGDTPLDYDLVSTSLTGAGVMFMYNHDQDDDTTPDVASPRMKTGDSLASLGSWAGSSYAHKHPDTKVSNEARAYNNRADTPGKPFVEGVRPPDGVGELTASTRTVVFASGITATKDIAGDGFPTAGVTTYTEDRVTQSVVIEGTYQGAPGKYSCDATCSATGSSAGIALGGEWKFVADAGAMTSVPDTNYLFFGWWLQKNAGGSPVSASAFTGQVGTAIVAPATNPNALTGSADYAGHAAGKFAISDPIGEADAGHFTADVALKATFGATGSVSGTIDNFMANEEAVDWSVRLRSAAWDNGNAGAYATAEADEGAGTVWSIDGKEAPSTSGSWGGQMYDEKPAGPGSDGSDVPTATTGTFQSQFGETHSMVGAFGASRE